MKKPYLGMMLENAEEEIVDYEQEVAKLKELMLEAATKMGFVSAWLAHPHDKTLANMRDKLREAAK